MSAASETDPQRIRSRMQRLRRRMNSDLQNVVANTQSILDWKDYVRRYPFGMIAMGVAAGFFVSPGRKVVPSVKLADESVKELIGQGGALRQDEKQESSVAPILAGALSAFSGLAFSSLSVVLRHHLEQYLSAERTRHSG